MSTDSPSRRIPPKIAAALAALVLAVAAFAAGLLTGDDAPQVPATTPVVEVQTVDAQGDPAPVTTPQTAVKQAAAGDLHGGARSEQPPGVSPAELDAADEQQERYAASDDLPAVTPAAAPQQAGCTTRLVGNYSSRRGVRPRLFVLHYTVSPNRPGWDDVWAITSLFNRPAFAASSHYIVDADGHCAYIVRESDKSWTQAAANPVAVSVEVIATGREGRYLAPAGYKKLGRIISDFGKRWDVPLQMGAVKGCTVVRPGIVTHQMLGACGGGHVDISPYSPAPVLAAAKAYRATEGKAAASRGKTCNQLRWHRGQAKAKGWTPERVARVQLLKKRAVSQGLNPAKCKA